MKHSFIILAILQVFSFLVAALPFIIVNTHTTVSAHSALPTHILPKRQDIFSQFESAVNSVLGINTATSTTSAVQKGQPTLGSVSGPTSNSVSSKSVQTLAPPATAAPPPSPSSTASSTSSSTSSTSTISSTSTSTTTTATDSSTSATSTSTSTSTSSSTSATASLGLTEPTNTPLASSSSDNGSKVPAAGIAVGVIMILLVALAGVWLVFRYHPGAQAWWAARQEKQRQERSYREALDGPNAGSPNLRDEALGADRSSRRRTMLQSFFAPATAALGGGKEIKRKPVNWGAQSPMTQTSPVDNEKMSMTASAAPMGRNTPTPTPSMLTPVIASAPPVPRTNSRTNSRTFVAELDSTPVIPFPVQPISPITIGRNDSMRSLPPVSPLTPHRVLPSISERSSSPRSQGRAPPVPRKGLSTLPPPVLMAKKGSDGVYRLG